MLRGMSTSRRKSPPHPDTNVIPVTSGTPVRTEAYLFEQLVVTIGDGRAQTRLVGDADVIYRLAFEIEKQAARHRPSTGGLP